MTTPGGRRVRIVYLHPALGIGGAEELRLLLLKQVDRTRFDVRVCCLGEKGAIGAEIEALGFPVDVLGRSDRTFALGTVRAVYRYLRAHSPDILQSSLFRTNWHGRIAGLLARVPVMIAEEHSLHDPAVRFFRYSPRLGPVFRRVDRWLARHTAAIVACSRAVAESIAADEGIPLDRFVVVPNAVDLEKVRPVRGREATRAGLGFDAEHVVVGTVSSLTPVKGHDVLLGAFAAARRQLPALRLLVVGDGPARGVVEAAVDRLGLGTDVRLVGATRALGDYLAAMDLFASAARSEGFGISLLEAMAVGLPCVAFRLGGIPEVIVDGETGVLVAAGDTAALGATIGRLASDHRLAARLGEAGRQHVASTFTSPRYADAMSQLYETLTQDASRRPLAVATCS